MKKIYNKPPGKEVNTDTVGRGIWANKTSQIRIQVTQRKMALIQKVRGREEKEGTRKTMERSAGKLVQCWDQEGTVS